jgi:hypothetical protein
MSYRSPTEPKYVPTSGAVNRMQQNLVSAAEEQLKAKKERENEIKADKTLDRQVAIGYGKALGESINGSEISGVLNTTYKGYNKEAAALERIMLDGKCATPDCEVETKQLQILKGAPDASLDLLSNVQVNIDRALGGNVDKTHYLYNKLEIAGRVIGKENYYGTEQGYGITVNRLKNDNGDYTGEQEIIFTGKEFGEDGWKINSETLAANPNLINEIPSFEEQSVGTTEASGLLIGDKNPQNAVVYGDQGKEQGVDISFAFKMDDQDPPQPIPGQYDTKLYTQTFTNDKTGVKTTYTSEVYVFNEDAIKARIQPEISAEIDTMFDKKVGGPNDAIALFNETFTNKNSGSYAVTEEDIKKYPWLTKDGKIDYLAGVPSENDFGEPGSIYDANGKLKSEVKELYQKIYTDHYMRENVLPKIKNIEVPDSALLTNIETPTQEIAEANTRALLGNEEDLPKK